MKEQQAKRKKEKGGRDASYEEAFKIAIAKEYFRGELGYVKLAQKYKLPSDSTVRHFVKWYKANYDIPALTAATPDSGSSRLQSQQTQPPVRSSAGSDDEAALLRRELEDALLKITALETMISIARTNFGIDILKKSGAGQSKS